MAQYADYFYYGGIGLAALGYVWLLVDAFGTDLVWGLAVLFIPPIGAPAFAMCYWNTSRNPFLILLAGISSILAGMHYQGAGP